MQDVTQPQIYYNKPTILLLSFITTLNSEDDLQTTEYTNTRPQHMSTAAAVKCVFCTRVGKRQAQTYPITSCEKTSVHQVKSLTSMYLSETYSSDLH